MPPEHATYVMINRADYETLAAAVDLYNHDIDAADRVVYAANNLIDNYNAHNV